DVVIPDASLTFGASLLIIFLFRLAPRPPTPASPVGGMITHANTLQHPTLQQEGNEMKAVVCSNAELKVVDRQEPLPAKGQSLLKVLRCGICGSDLHVRYHCDHFCKLMGRVGYNNFPKSDEELVFGHEFCGEVLDHGPGSKKAVKPGTRVCVVPMVR